MSERVYPSILVIAAANHYAEMMQWMPIYTQDDITSAWLAQIFPRAVRIEAPFYLAAKADEVEERYWHCCQCGDSGYDAGTDNTMALRHVSTTGHDVRVRVTRKTTYRAVNT